MNTWKRVTIFLVIVACSLLLVGPALAHQIQHAHTHHGEDFSFIDGRNTAVICDKERDFRDAYIDFEKANGESGYKYDTNGASSGCGRLTPDSFIIAYRTCEPNAGCGKYHYRQ